MLPLPGLVSLSVSERRESVPVERAAAAPDRLSEAFRFLCWAVLYGLIAVTVVRPADDWDIWWHIRTGQWVVEHGTIPQTDPFSQYGQGKTWVAYSWLFEVLVYELYQGLGLYGIVLFRAVLSLAVAAALHRFIAKRVPGFFAAIILFAAVVLASLPLLSERPWLFTILFTTLTLDVVLDWRDGRTTWLTWTLPFFYVVWANVHIQFVYGLFVLGLACTAPIIDRLRGPSAVSVPRTTFLRADWWKLVGLTAACAAATLVNPYHVRLYGVILDYGVQTGAFRLVQELNPPDFHELSSWIGLALMVSAVFALGRRSRLPALEVLLLAAAAYFAFRARRDMWFLCLASLAILVRAGAAQATASDRYTWTIRRRLLLTATLLAVVSVAGVARCLTPGHMEEVAAARFPAEAAAAVEHAGCPGPLYNSFNWGGYLIWRLPQLPVAIDGRTNLHGDERLQRSFDTWLGLKGWHDDPELAAAGVVIAESDGALASLLRQDARFGVMHEDEVAVVFIRTAHTDNSRLPCLSSP